MAKQVEPKKPLPKTAVSTKHAIDFDEYDKEFMRESVAKPTDVKDVRTTAELLAYLDHNPKAELEATLLAMHKETKKIYRVKAGKKEFAEAFTNNNKRKPGSRVFKEAFSKLQEDTFALGGYSSAGNNYGGNYGYSAANNGLIGDDFIPLLGGPFYKQLYYYNDYLLATGNAFFAYNHDPIAHAIIEIKKNFILGRGVRVEVVSKNPIAQALWAAFEEANDLQHLLEQMCIELSIYGELMVWWLPHNDVFVTYKPTPGQPIPKGIIPRIRSLDPTNINEIVTVPEDIQNKLWYVWVNPTQYQIYTRGVGAGTEDKGSVVPTTKFIYQSIPAAEIDHYKINVVSNEKRGRSDLYPVLGYLKRLRDLVNYRVISAQKNAAWSIDTTLMGDESDIANYIAAQAQAGTLPPAGSEFVHTKAIERQYLGNTNTGGGADDLSYSECLNMICAGSQTPFNYLGTHESAGSTRASALVATEPIAKHIEMRRVIFERMIKDMGKRLMAKFKIPDVEFKVVFPEITVQDRSAKLKDLYLAQESHWLSPKRCASIAAKEFDANDYDYEKEQKEIKELGATTPGIVGQGLSPQAANPLTAPAKVPVSANPNASAMPKDQKKAIADNG